MDRNYWCSWCGYYLVVYLITILCTALFLTEVREWDGATILITLTDLPVYALLYTLPGALLSTAVAAVFRRGHSLVAVFAAALFSAVTMLILLADLGLYRGFGFHFNLFVWNLLTTPGGFASMGLRSDTIIPLALAVIAGLSIHGVLAYFLIFFREGKAGMFFYRPLRGWRKYVWLAVLAAALVTGSTAYAWNHFIKNPVPLLAAGRIPAHQQVTMRNLFRKLGRKEPKREEMLMRTTKNASIRYPMVPIRRIPGRKRFNLVWLCCESLRADMLNPEVMPNTWHFAQKHGIRFTNNRSGGNGTRQGLFSMFYGLYGNYWHPFLAARQGALLIDWMLEDNYDILCFTSAKFTYPEFDQTVFAKLPADRLRSFDQAKTYERDIRNTGLLIEFINSDHGGRPFMTFMFFESPHHPYEFPQENAKFKPYIEKMDYLKSHPEQAEKIKNRYRNSCLTLDGFLHQICSVLKKNKMLDNTIVVIVGDHGEEFYEHGKLGHNSTFSNEQIRTPLVLHLPGKAPAVYSGMSSHVDIIAMLAPYFRVENPPEDFSLGKNLLSENSPKRKYSVIAGWDSLFFAGNKYKMLLPINNFDSITSQLFDAEDRKLSDRSAFYRECRDELIEVQQDIRRFLK